VISDICKESVPKDANATLKMINECKWAEERKMVELMIIKKTCSI